MKRRNIITNNKEIYEKFNMLNFSSEVMLRNVKPIQVEKILSNINKHEKILDMEKIGDYYVVRRVGQLNYNIYLR
jgi:hypothetical protein